MSTLKHNTKVEAMTPSLKSLLKYDETSGIFFDRETKKPIGTTAKDGYVYIWVNKNRYRADKLALRFVTGKWYHCPIIHKDGIKSNNWISNLQPMPIKKPNNNNKSKVTGVHWSERDKRWIALIYADNKQKYVARSKSFDVAVLARYKAEVLYGYEPNSTAHQYIKRMFL